MICKSTQWNEYHGSPKGSKGVPWEDSFGTSSPLNRACELIDTIEDIHNYQ